MLPDPPNTGFHLANASGRFWLPPPLAGEPVCCATSEGWHFLARAAPIVGGEISWSAS